MLQESHILNRRGILWSTSPVHIMVGDSERIDFSCETFYSCSQREWWWFGDGSCWESLTHAVFSVARSLALLCLVSLSQGEIFWPSKFLSSCVCFLILSHMVVLVFWVCFLYFLRWCRYYCSKTEHYFFRVIRLGSFLECCQSTKVTAIPKRAPSPDSKNRWLISITLILSKVYEKLVSHRLSSFCKIFFLNCCSVWL